MTVQIILSTPELSNQYKIQNRDIIFNNFYGESLTRNLHLWHYYVYEQKIPVDTVLLNEEYGGDSGHSGGSFYTSKHILYDYHNFLKNYFTKTPNMV